MVDPATAIASIGASIDLAKGLLKLKESSDSADAKLAIADRMTKLADAQVQIAELKADEDLPPKTTSPPRRRGPRGLSLGGRD
ncbi:MAG: hypothetical protein HQL36_05675 [Alphaproteobacteria bacterium]|nr:hypothetical protein [Alphaproteobacteria bacterium]MBF0251741.1 hypothetical protein [Alphaproteobacteria bacterium]